MADRLDPDLVKPLLVRGMVDLWCGTRWLKSADGNQTVLFKLRLKDGRMNLVTETREAKCLDVNGYVAFAVCQLGNQA